MNHLQQFLELQKFPHAKGFQLVTFWSCFLKAQRSIVLYCDSASTRLSTLRHIWSWKSRSLMWIHLCDCRLCKREVNPLKTESFVLGIMAVDPVQDVMCVYPGPGEGDNKTVRKEDDV